MSQQCRPQRIIVTHWPSKVFSLHGRALGGEVTATFPLRYSPTKYLLSFLEMLPTQCTHERQVVWIVLIQYPCKRLNSIYTIFSQCHAWVTLELNFYVYVVLKCLYLCVLISYSRASGIRTDAVVSLTEKGAVVVVVVVVDPLSCWGQWWGLNLDHSLVALGPTDCPPCLPYLCLWNCFITLCDSCNSSPLTLFSCIFYWDEIHKI